MGIEAKLCYICKGCRKKVKQFNNKMNLAVKQCIDET